MINIWLRLFDLEIKNKHIIDAKDKFVQNLHGALKKEQKLKAELQDKNNENNQLAKLQIARQNINNMEKHNKDMENIRVEKDYL